MPQVLIVLSAASTMSLTDGSARPVGFWPEELLDPLGALTRAGVDTVMATPDGKPAVPDAAGFTTEGTGYSTERCDDLRKAVADLQGSLDAPRALQDVNAGDYDAVFVPGGYAPMVDLWADPSCGTLLSDFHQAGKAVAAVCHGPAALLSCLPTSAGWPFHGYRMTAFTDTEEQDVGLLGKLPWTAQQALRKSGAHFVTQTAWSEHIVIDRNLMTGQNPASAHQLAHHLLRSLEHAAQN